VNNKKVTLSLDSELLGLLGAVNESYMMWQLKFQIMENASDEVWLSHMDEISLLENRYRDYQDQLCRHLTNAVAVSTENVIKEPRRLPAQDCMSHYDDFRILSYQTLLELDASTTNIMMLISARQITGYWWNEALKRQRLAYERWSAVACTQVSGPLPVIGDLMPASTASVTVKHSLKPDKDRS
jgi:hypothetical protein